MCWRQVPRAIHQKGRFVKMWALICHILDLVLYVFWLFCKVKVIMKSKYFEMIQDVSSSMTAWLKTLTKEDFQNCLGRWQKNRASCVRSEGECLRNINDHICRFWLHVVSGTATMGHTDPAAWAQLPRSGPNQALMGSFTCGFCSI